MTDFEATCAICHTHKPADAGWFLLVENRWQDRLKIVKWNTLLAKRPGAFSACGTDHVMELVTQWIKNTLDRVQ